MSISISPNLAGVRLPGATLGTPAEQRNDAAMAAQDSATETQSEGLKPQRTMLDRLVDQPSALARFAD